LSATNDVHLTVSTNWPSTNTASRVSAVLFKGGAADHGLTWNTNWVLLGLTNSSLTIPSNKVARAAFRVDGRGETNVVWGWSVQQ
jgi:hypothetical protein